METINENILFASLNLPTPNRGDWLDWVKSVDNSLWRVDTFRNSSALALMTSGGVGTAEDIQAQNFLGNDYSWTPWTCKSIIDYFDAYIFPWLGTRTRVLILKTPSKSRNHEHVDCSPREFGSKQHKLRIVISGNTSSLYFLTKMGNINIPETDKPFLMEGSWPHGMINNTWQTKYTICVGTPWRGSKIYPEFEKIMLKSDYTPVDFENRFFSPKY